MELEQATQLVASCDLFRGRSAAEVMDLVTTRETAHLLLERLDRLERRLEGRVGR